MAGAVPLAAPPPLTAGSLYEALRVGRAATRVEIKAAYRAMAKRLHPDTSRASGAGAGAAAAAFLEIRRAYETLSDPGRQGALRPLAPAGAAVRASPSSAACGCCAGGRRTSAGRIGSLGTMASMHVALPAGADREMDAHAMLGMDSAFPSLAPHNDLRV